MKMFNETTFSSQVVLGMKYRDSVSGYEGVATAVFFYLHGCERVMLEQWVAAAGEMRELSFDAPRLVPAVAKDPVPLQTARTGGYQKTPPRRTAQ